MQTHTGYICLTFVQSVFSNVFSNCLPAKMQSHIACICLTFLQCVFSYVSSRCLPLSLHFLTSMLWSQLCSLGLNPQSKCRGGLWREIFFKLWKNTIFIILTMMTITIGDQIEYLNSVRCCHTQNINLSLRQGEAAQRGGRFEMLKAGVLLHQRPVLTSVLGRGAR